ncbi:MAG TPA: long-chain-fatty-acid--CoA ligase [Burkholderiaceae bacterium]|jgi:long-chain acyl-CoA synthetase|nr:long-chain-fatty-acid--CoA ligase [Burkholderiaceae bacterium]
MEKIWLKSYPPGVPAEVKIDRYRSIPQLIEASVAKYRQRPAYRCMGKTLTFDDVDKMSAQFGAWLQSKGLAKGARVAVMMPNVLQYPIAVFGILRAGCTVVNVNPLYTPRELEHQLKDSGAEAIVILENFATTLQQVIARTQVKHVVLAALGDLLGLKGLVVNLVVRKVKKMVPPFELPGAVRFNDVLSAGAGMTLRPVELGPEDIAFLQYTGGTTGVSKGAMLTHQNILANIAQVQAWFAPVTDENNPHIMVAPLPLYHIYALTCNCLYMMADGGCCLLIPNPRDIPGFIKELASNKFTAISGLNTLYNALLNHPDFGKIDFSHLRLATAGGMAMQTAVAKRWQEATGVPILEGYGLTETSPVATTNPVNIKEHTGTIGLPLPSTIITIRDDDGNELPVGQVGEICIAGPQVMKGYWNRPEETAKVMTRDGAFRTGDIGVMDERGFIKIVDRKKDMILVSGFNVYPNEIEDVVASCPGVLECAVIGVPDEKSGEVPKVFVVKKDPALTEQQVLEHCRKNLTAYKVPRYVEFRSELPKTPVGKILRRALRDEPAKKAA